MTRTEVFTGTGPTSSSHIKVKVGGTRDGRFTAAQATLIYEAGAFPGSPVPSGCRTMFAPYDIANGFVEGYDVVTNVPKAAAYRAPGSPAASFAAEQAIDELCEKLGVDPVGVPPQQCVQGGQPADWRPRLRGVSAWWKSCQATPGTPRTWRRPYPSPRRPAASPGAASLPARGSTVPARPPRWPASCPMAR